MFIELKQPPAKEGDPVQVITALSEHIMFAFRAPLQTVFQVAVGTVILPYIGDYEALLKILEGDGMAILDTPEGGKAVVNKEHILFFVSPSLGIYSLMFRGEIGMSVKATQTDIIELFEKKSVIVS